MSSPTATCCISGLPTEVLIAAAAVGLVGSRRKAASSGNARSEKAPCNRGVLARLTNCALQCLAVGHSSNVAVAWFAMRS